MIKYTDTQVVFEEIPDEITLGINISNCTHNCPGCHSPYLREDIGIELDFKTIDELLKQNCGITCLLFLGEGNDAESLKELISYVKERYPDLKVGLYSGRKEVNEDFYWDNLDYLKIGPYIEERGPLNSPTTHQRLYKKVDDSIRTFEVVNGVVHPHWTDITDRFWNEKA